MQCNPCRRHEELLLLFRKIVSHADDSRDFSIGELKYRRKKSSISAWPPREAGWGCVEELVLHLLNNLYGLCGNERSGNEIGVPFAVAGPGILDIFSHLIHIPEKRPRSHLHVVRVFIKV